MKGEMKQLTWGGSNSPDDEQPRRGGGGSGEWLVGETKSKTRNEQWKMGGLLEKERIIKEKKIYLDGIRPIYMAKGIKISTDVVLVCADIRTKS